MSNKGKKNGSTSTRKDAANAINTRSTLVTLFDEFADTLGSKERVRVSWPSDRIAKLTKKILPKEQFEGTKVNWYTTPKNALVPNMGFSSLGQSASAKHTMVVAAFGRQDFDLQEAFDYLLARDAKISSSIPVFLLDEPAPKALIKAGVTYEVFDKEVYCGPDQHHAFKMHFEFLWQKWCGRFLVDLSQKDFLERRIGNITRYVEPLQLHIKLKRAVRYETQPLTLPCDVHELRAKYQIDGLDKNADSFFLCRILGNDLPPRHCKGQTEQNLRFILTH